MDRVIWSCPQCSKRYAVPHKEGLTICISCAKVKASGVQFESQIAASLKKKKSPWPFILVVFGSNIALFIWLALFGGTVTIAQAIRGAPQEPSNQTLVKQVMEVDKKPLEPPVKERLKEIQRDIPPEVEIAKSIDPGVASAPDSRVKSNLQEDLIDVVPMEKSLNQNLGVEAIEATLPGQVRAEADESPIQQRDATVTPPVDSAPETERNVVKKPSELAQDKTSIELNAAVAAYEKEKDGFRGSVLEELARREASARKDGDKKSVDQIAMERKEFETWGVLPKNLPSAVVMRRVDARANMEKAFNAAIKSYTKATQDEAATATEKELRLFRGEIWRHLNLEAVKLNGNSFQIPKNSSVSTKVEYSGPIEIHATARTEKNNIRLHANRGSCVIFNWEVNPKELRLTRPDGRDQVESGSIVAVPATPLKPGVWYNLRWRISNDGMAVFVNGQAVFSESRTNDLTKKSKVLMTASESVIEVREFYVVVLAMP